MRLIYKILGYPVIVLMGAFLIFHAMPVTYTMHIRAIDLEHVKQYKTQVAIFRVVVDSNDTIKLVINSPGGYVVETFQIINYLKGTKARVVAEVQNLAASGAADLMVVADEVKIDPYALILFHRGFYLDPWGNKILVSDEAPLGRILLNFAKDHIFPYLDPKEIADYHEGKDIIFTGAEFKKRLARVPHSLRTITFWDLDPPPIAVASVSSCFQDTHILVLLEIAKYERLVEKDLHELTSTSYDVAETQLSVLKKLLKAESRCIDTSEQARQYDIDVDRVIDILLKYLR